MDKWLFKDCIKRDTMPTVPKESWIWNSSKQHSIIVLVISTRREAILNTNVYLIKWILIEMVLLAIKTISSFCDSTLEVRVRLLKNKLKRIKSQNLNLLNLNQILFLSFLLLILQMAMEKHPNKDSQNWFIHNLRFQWCKETKIKI